MLNWSLFLIFKITEGWSIGGHPMLPTMRLRFESPRGKKCDKPSLAPVGLGG